MIEKIGNVTLDLTYYGGQDLYSDGPIEDELLSLAQTHSEEELNSLIQRKFSWPLLYHFSQIRQNIVTWLPINKNHKVLEIGAGCGAITGGLASMAEHVTCIELSKKRSMINANRNKNYDNIQIMVGNFTDVEPNLTEKFDYITLIGVFEYAECYIQSENPYIDFLNRIKKHLKPHGKIVIAIENRLGMKYIAGCKEDHTALIGEGLDYYPRTKGVKTYDKKELQDIFREAGFFGEQFYYPYPDYKLPLEIYSDEWLPKKGALVQNINNLDQSRIRFFDESSGFDKAIELGVFDEISNSFEIVLENPETEKQVASDGIDEGLHVIYTKFSNDRGPKIAIQTRILSDINGNLAIEKLPASIYAKNHVEQIYGNEEILQSEYKDTRFVPNAIKKIGSGTYFEFLEEKTLEEQLDDCLFNNQKEQFFSLFDSFVSEIRKASKDYLNIDLIPANVIGEGPAWHVIDYEWVYAKDALPISGITTDFVIYRAAHYYLETSLKRKSFLGEKELFDHLGYDEKQLHGFRGLEKAFQQSLDDGYYKLATAKNEHHKLIVDSDRIIKELEEKQWTLSVKYFYQNDIPSKEEIITLEECDLHTVYAVLSDTNPISRIEISRPGESYIYGVDKVCCYKKASASDAFSTDMEEIHQCYLDGVLIGHEQVFLNENQCLFVDFTDVDSIVDRVELILRETPLTPDAMHVMTLKNTEIAQQKEYIEGLKENIRLLEEAVHTMENSSSWKITKPLRSISQKLHGE